MILELNLNTLTLNPYLLIDFYHFNLYFYFYQFNNKVDVTFSFYLLEIYNFSILNYFL